MSPSEPVLIVDDDREVAAVLEDLISSLGYDTRVCNDPLQALSELAKREFCAIVTDIMMPEMDGIEFLRYALKKDPALKVIVMTGHASTDTAIAALKHGAYDYLTKPVHIEALGGALERALHTRAIELENQQQKQRLADLNQRLQSANAELNRVIKEKTQILVKERYYAQLGRMLPGIMHNINSPLTGIFYYTELLKSGKRYDEESVETIFQQAERINTLISTISQKLDANIHRRIELLDLNVVIQTEIAFLMSDLFFKHEIRHLLNLNADLPQFYGMSADFAQAISALLSNAMEAVRQTPRKEITISTAMDDEFLYVKIADTGTGISKEYLGDIFSPFFTTWTENDKDGVPIHLGLGLFTARNAIERYGATIGINTEPGNTVFEIKVPYKQLQTQDHLKEISQA